MSVFPAWLRVVARLLWLGAIVSAVVIPFRYFVAQPFIVSGASMVPTFNPHEYLIIDRWTYRSETPERGEVIIFKYPLDPSIFFIKRIIGLPGETVRIEGGEVKIVTGDREIALEEPYRNGEMKEDSSFTLAGDEYFVLGDSREASSDSRVWGPVKERYLVGRPAVRLFPFSRAELLPGMEKN